MSTDERETTEEPRDEMEDLELPEQQAEDVKGGLYKREPRDI